jgi:hypothetical protein
MGQARYLRAASRNLTALAAATIGLTFAQPALADNAYYTANASYCLNGQCDNYSNQGATPQGATANIWTDASASDRNGGEAFAQITFAPGAPMLINDLIRLQANSTVSYTFQVQGPTDALVPVDIFASVGVSRVAATDYQGHPWQLGDNRNYDGEGDGLLYPSNFAISGGSVLRVSQNSAPYSYLNEQPEVLFNFTSYPYYPESLGPYTKNPEGSGKTINNLTMLFRANTDINVYLTAGVLLDYTPYYDTGSSNQYGSITARADPRFVISDPDFAGYKIVGVPGAAVAPGAVPEPATWLMLVTGFGLTGAALRRRNARLLSA